MKQRKSYRWHVFATAIVMGVGFAATTEPPWTTLLCLVGGVANGSFWVWLETR
jgi:hypothetical protein